MWYFNGIIDEFAIFNVELSDQDIKTIMDKGLGSIQAAVDFSGKLVNTWSNIKTR